MSISKEEAAAISAAIIAHLSKPRKTEKTSDVTHEMQVTLELLVEKVSRLEKQLEELSSSEMKEKKERK